LGVAIIVILVISILGAGIGIITFQPAVKTLSFDTGFWDQSDVDLRIQQQRDSLYDASIAIPAFVIGVAILYAYLSANRSREF
jgi:hypothetical protein